MRYMLRPPSAFYSSFATGGNCNTNVKGQTCWTGIIKDTTLQDGTKTPVYDSVCVNNSTDADNCSFARTAFCKKHGCASPPTQSGQAVHAGADDPLVKATGTVTQAAQDAGKAIVGGNSPPSKNPVSNCDNCTNGDNWYSFLDPSAWGCKLGKLSCEWQFAANQGWKGVGQFLSDNALWIVGGGMISIVLLTVVFKKL